MLEVAEHDAAHAPQDAQKAGARPVDADVARSAGASRARARRRRSGTPPSSASPGTAIASSTSSSALTTVTWRPLRWIATPARSSIRSVWSRLRCGSRDGRGAVGGERGQQHARLDLGAGDGQLVGDRAQARAAHASAAGSARRVRCSSAPIWRSGSAIRSTGRRRIDSSPSSVNERPSWAASQPGSRRSSVPALPTSIGLLGLARLAQAGAADHDLLAAHLARARRARARPRAWTSCRRRAGSARSAPARRPSRRAARRGGRSTCRAARAARPASAAGGLEAHVHARAPPGSRGRRSARCARLASSARRAIHSATTPWRLSSEGDSAMSTMFTPARPSASAISAITPGRLGTEARSSCTGPPASPAPQQRVAVGARALVPVGHRGRVRRGERRAHRAAGARRARRAASISASRLDM